MLTSGTALALIFSPEGFVFAADGLEQETSGKTVTTSSQKIFQVRECVAFSCAGFHSIRDEETGTIKFEFPATVREAFEEAVKSSSGDLTNLAEDVAGRVCAKLEDLRERKAIENYPEDDGSGLFARVFIAGFFGGEPRAGELRFRRAGVAAACDIKTSDAPGFFAYSGSIGVWKALVDNSDSRLGPYRKDAFDKILSFYGPNLEEAKLIAEGFIRACSDPTVHEAYPECRSIGGDMRVATITRQTGFRWIT